MATAATAKPRSTTAKKPRAARTAAPKATPAPKTRATSNAKETSRGFGQGALLGAAAAGLVAGLIAAVGRKVAVQAVSTRSGDWMEALKNEHKGALAIFEKIEKTNEKQTAKRAFLLMQLKHALAKHAFEEENVIYPALRANAEREEADHLNHDHGYVKQFLYELDNLSRSSTAWLDKVREFHTAIAKHMREEEDTVFPQLHARLAKEDNAELTSAMNREGFKLA